MGAICVKRALHWVGRDKPAHLRQNLTDQQESCSTCLHSLGPKTSVENVWSIFSNHTWHRQNGDHGDHGDHHVLRLEWSLPIKSALDWAFEAWPCWSLKSELQFQSSQKAQANANDACCCAGSKSTRCCFYWYIIFYIYKNQGICKTKTTQRQEYP